MSKPINFQQREIKFRAWDGEHMIHDIGIRSGMALHLDTGKMHDWPLMQYTGLNDKDGREIYEGDVVKADGLLPGAIIFYESAFRTEEAAEPLADDAELYGGFTVIGNIYENPELIKP